MTEQALNLDGYEPLETTQLGDVPVREVDLFDYWKVTDSKGGAMVDREITEPVIRKINTENREITGRTIATSILAMQQCGLVWSNEQVEDAIDQMGQMPVEERKEVIDQVARQVDVIRETERATKLFEKLSVEEQANLTRNTVEFSSATANRSGDTLRYLETLVAKGLISPEGSRRAESVLRILYAWGEHMEAPFERKEKEIELEENVK